MMTEAYSVLPHSIHSPHATVLPHKVFKGQTQYAGHHTMHLLSSFCYSGHFYYISALTGDHSCVFVLLDAAKFQIARHSLSYIQEIGHGWFGKVRFFFNSVKMNAYVLCNPVWSYAR